MKLGSQSATYTCNICNEGFNKIYEVKKHISIDHNDTIMQITKNIEKEEDSSSFSSDECFGDSWLAKFDDDGNRLV